MIVVTGQLRRPRNLNPTSRQITARYAFAVAGT